MTKTIQFRTAMQQKEARLVAGMLNEERRTQYELYAYCADYFRDSYRGVFFANEDVAAEILQNAFITLWENIENRRIFVEDGIVKGRNSEPLHGTLLTYFMGIARNKYLEYVRKHPVYADPETELGRLMREEGFDPNRYTDMQYETGDNRMIEIVAEIISRMSPRCNQILTMFYYEEKSLEEILAVLPEVESYNALKSRKYKCLETLRKSAHEIYYRELNA